ncbi:MAG: hypothetical protein HY363_00340 [Candidatus Aenigmarchaeota archaeon]|nr:hypothetical protein [Candidatus Aenigmarchaeota archaeon]
MLEKLRDMLSVADKIKQVNSAIDSHAGKVHDMQEQILKLQDSITLLANTHSKALKDIHDVLNQTRESMLAVEDMKKKLDEEVCQFRMLKGQLQTKLVDRFDQELKSELKRNTDELNINVKNYSKVLQDANRFSAALSQTTGELQKWLLISKSIQEKDFDMTRTARQLIEYGEDKKALLQKIDMLERLVGKMRRQTSDSVMAKSAR